MIWLAKNALIPRDVSGFLSRASVAVVTVVVVVGTKLQFSSSELLRSSILMLANLPHSVVRLRFWLLLLLLLNELLLTLAVLLVVFVLILGSDIDVKFPLPFSEPRDR